MTAHTKVKATVSRRVLAMLGVLAALLVALPAAAQDRSEPPDREDRFSDCLERSLLDYNACLMKSSDDFSRLICDLSWELQAAKCGAEALGAIRRAFRG